MRQRPVPTPQLCRAREPRNRIYRSELAGRLLQYEYRLLCVCPCNESMHAGACADGPAGRGARAVSLVESRGDTFLVVVGLSVCRLYSMCSVVCLLLAVL